MASARRWSVSAGRTVVSGLLAVVAVFLLFVSMGAGSWVLAALGVAVLAAAVGVYVVAALNNREYAYVPGTGHVLSCSPPPAGTSQGSCVMHLVVHAPGLDDVAVRIRDSGVPVSKWPDVGTTLPIYVAVGDARRIRVRWDEVRTHGEVAEGRDEEYRTGRPEVEEPYLGGLLDEEYDEAGLADVEPRGQVIELDVMDPALFRSEPAEEGPGYSPSISFAPDTALDPEVDLDRHAGLADARRERAVAETEPALAETEPALAETEALAQPAAPVQPTAAEREGAGDPVQDRVADGAGAGEAAAGEAAAAAAPAPPVRRRPRPSPRPRRPADDQIPAQGPESDAGGGVATLPAPEPPPSPPRPSPPPSPSSSPSPSRSSSSPPSSEREVSLPPLQVEHVLAADPAVPAMTDAATTEPAGTDVADAYLAASKPPGQPRGRVRGVGVTLFVANLGRSLAFYRDLLGFRQVDLGLGSAVLESGDARIVLRRVADLPPVDRRLIHLLLEVPDVQAAYDELLLQGVEFVHRPRPVSRFEELELWSAAFRDPDGHGIALTHWAAVRP